MRPPLDPPLQTHTSLLGDLYPVLLPIMQKLDTDYTEYFLVDVKQKKGHSVKTDYTEYFLVDVKQKKGHSVKT